MSTTIKIKRSSTTNTPSLAQGELGYSWGTGVYPETGGTTTAYGKLYLGTGTESGGVAANIEAIGGKYFTDLLDHNHGILSANSAIITDASSKINVLNVDNLTLDSNTLSSTDTDGDIILDPNGNGNVLVPDDTYLSFGSDKDAKIRYDEASDDRLEIEGADWYFTNGVGVKIADSTASSDSTTGALVVDGGVGIGGNLYVGGSFNVGSSGTPTNLDISGDLTVGGGDINLTVATSVNITDNLVSAFTVSEGSNNYIKIDTTDAAENLTLGNNLSDVDVVVKDNSPAAFQLKESSNVYIDVDTSNANEKITLGNSLSLIDHVIADNKTSAFVVKQDTTEYINVSTSDGTEKITLGNTSANTQIIVRDAESSAFSITEGSNTYFNVSTSNSSEQISIGNDISKVDVELIDNASDAFKIWFADTDDNNTPKNIFKVDTTEGSVLSSFVEGNVQIDNDLNIDGSNITTTNTTTNLLNTNTLTVNAFGEATTVSIAAQTGTTTINNNLDVGIDVEIAGTTLDSTSTTFSLLDSPTTVTAFSSATNLNIGTAATVTDFGDLLIKGSTIYSESNAGTITIDPYPSAGDQGGDVVVRGNFIVTGTTTTVNSTVMTVNDPVVTVGDNNITKITVQDTAPDGRVLAFDNATGLTAPSPNDRTDGSYQITASGGSGTGAVFTVTVDIDGNATVVLDNGGANYLDNEVLTLAASGNFGGSTDITVTTDGVTTSATAGVIRLDSVDGLYVGDSVSGHSNIQASSTIATINTGTFEITLNNPLNGVIPSGTEISIVRGADDGMDRGIQFNYYNGGAKLGFFGYDETAVTEGLDTTYYFTYIPDASSAGNVYSGTVGSAYFNTVKLDIAVENGIPFFDAYDRLTTTAAAGSADATTSNQILTVDANGVPVWTTTIDGGSY